VKAVRELLPIPAGAVSLTADITEPEASRDELTVEFRFNVPLLADRLTTITNWLFEHETTSGRGIGLFGASTGAAAALRTAAARPVWVQAVVSRGGRPDLAGDRLHLMHRPTLLIVGERDGKVLEANKLAMANIGGACRLEIVPRATHLFEEPGALDQVATRASDWFVQHLKPLPRLGSSPKATSNHR
jgi:putative phosphoribosyl transferase